MKKHINLWLVMFLAISLALPIYSMAADMRMTLRTEDGFSVTTNTPTIKSFAVDNDNNLVVILADPPILDFGNPYPEITIDTPVTCTIVNNAYVKGNPGTTFSFTVRTTTAGATLSSTSDPTHPSIVPSNYGASFVASGNTGTFSWNTTGAPAGKYLAVFSATQTTYTSQLVVVINIALQYKLTLTAGANGLVSPAGDSYYDPGTQVQISATSSSGYYLSGWSDGGTGNPRTVTMDQDRTISASFTQTPPTYDVTAQVVNSAGGSVTPASRTGITSGSTTTFTVTTNTGYTASVSEGSLSGTTWTTAPVTSTHTATVTFTLNTYTVTASVVNSAGGSVTPASQTGVSHGSTTTFTVTTNSGYTASVSEGSLSGATWTTDPVTSNHTATITFTQQNTTTCQSGDLGTPLSWNIRAGGTYGFCIPEGKLGIMIRAIGLTDSTYATLTWTSPNGTVYPTNPDDGLLWGQGTRSVNLRILSPPAGRHILSIIGPFSGYWSVDF